MLLWCISNQVITTIVTIIIIIIVIITGVKVTTVVEHLILNILCVFLRL